MLHLNVFPLTVYKIMNFSMIQAVIFLCHDDNGIILDSKTGLEFVSFHISKIKHCKRYI